MSKPSDKLQNPAIVLKIKPDRKLGGVSMQVVKDIIYAEWGNMTQIAKRLSEHLDRTVYREHVFVHIHNRPELLRACDDAGEIPVDISEHTLKGALLAGDIGVAKYILSTKGKRRGWGLGNIVGSDGNGQIETVTTRGVEILSYPSEGFAPAGTQSVVIRAVSPPAADDESVEDPTIIPADGSAIIEGDPIIDDHDAGSGMVIEGTLARAPEPPAVEPCNPIIDEPVREPEPAPQIQTSRWGRVTQRLPAQPDPPPPPEEHPTKPARFPKSPAEAAGLPKPFWD